MVSDDHWLDFIAVELLTTDYLQHGLGDGLLQQYGSIVNFDSKLLVTDLLFS